ncbi:MAG: transferase [Bacteroidetes bacterium B1(2017)]|nr:MAG: transferase [Bacteroidetes bacterium B1(2017)]
MKLIFSFISTAISWIESIYLFILFKKNRVHYSSFPKNYGFLLMKNDGHINIGSNVIFNSSKKANMVGLTKPCSIRVTENGKLNIGNNSGFSGVTIYCVENISIGNFVTIGGNVCIWDTDFHPMQHLDRRAHNISKIKTAPVDIHDDVFIGANSIILKGVTIGQNSIVGAGSVVTKDIPKNEIWAGNPAKFIRTHTQLIS